MNVRVKEKRVIRPIQEGSVEDLRARLRHLQLKHDAAMFQLNGLRTKQEALERELAEARRDHEEDKKMFRERMREMLPLHDAFRRLRGTSWALAYGHIKGMWTVVDLLSGKRHNRLDLNDVIYESQK